MRMIAFCCLLFASSLFTFEQEGSSSLELAEIHRFPFGIFYNSEKWEKLPRPITGFAVLSFQRIKEPVFAAVIAERIPVSKELFPQILIENATRAGGKNIEVLYEEQRVVSGLDITFIAWRGDLQEERLIYMTYVYTGGEGTIQFTTYTSEQFFKQFRVSMLQLLNGLHRLID